MSCVVLAPATALPRGAVVTMVATRPCRHQQKHTVHGGLHLYRHHRHVMHFWDLCRQQSLLDTECQAGLGSRLWPADVLWQVAILINCNST